MKALTVRYERLKSTGNFEHEKVAIEVQVEEGETAQQAFAAAREFVNRALPDPKREQETRRAQGILAKPDMHLVRDVRWAEEFLAGKTGPQDDDLPF